MSKFDKIIMRGLLEQTGERLDEQVPPAPAAPADDPLAAPPPADPAMEAPLPPEEPEDESTPDVINLGIELVQLAKDALFFKGDIDPGALARLNDNVDENNIGSIEDIIRSIVSTNDTVDAGPEVDYSKTS
jgi:hypothetical protein